MALHPSQLPNLTNLEIRAHTAERLRKRALHHRQLALSSLTDRVSRQTHSEEADWLESEAQRLYHD